MDWEEFRVGQEIDLLRAYEAYTGKPLTSAVRAFLDTAASLRPIVSRQVAAVAIATAVNIDATEQVLREANAPR